MTRRYVVVGIGADGWAGLSDRARSELRTARVILGSARQLALVDSYVGAETLAWRSPMSGHLDELLGDAATALPHGTPDDADIHVLASGDPMFHGIGSRIAAAVGPDRVTVISSPSSVSLAAVAMGWDLSTVVVVSAVTAPAEAVAAALDDGRRLLVLSRDAGTPERVATVCTERGFGDSTLHVLGSLGGPDQCVRSGRARDWSGPSPALSVIAVDCVGPTISAAPGLPDTEYENDGQLTKRVVRSVTVAALRPGGSRLLWDVGAGSGSVGIEWLRAAPDARVIAFEAHSGRSEMLRRNASRHGVSHRVTVLGAAPGAFVEAPAPDTVFLGGGVGTALLDEIWALLRPGGRIVGNAVTVETQEVFAAAHRRWGGELIRVAVENAEPIGRLTAWRPALPIVQWVADKPVAQEDP
ncbi:bifunctional cobalt-precorrin-7 (C(5))-methyltransferase/cobalt-precorrin-6B (C(15))-methyltransferase [Gordonia shandongensis]|uniref:bifunctional cobalt-precorrin-7 (C(5))-methyltransferase/cobalt-precorrin-6B (C(15))-methyltransferase n=1 Tax=Gordonia shandongensis TaxID=376351 RepID=UPI000411001E|nr:bifunctional cobalt-precorrin-7 (C(5))-methyltransferase/cobalt-precorrin-6B (C(15))-methyltransferase [Gordonia shandongensis]